MSRCDYEGVFYRVFCVSLLIIAFTFTVILTNVFVDIDNLLSRKEREPTEKVAADHVTDGYKATEVNDYYIGRERNDDAEGVYRTKRSPDPKNKRLHINSPKSKSYLTNRLAALLEALDDEPEITTPKDNGNIYIKTVKQRNNIAINEVRPEKRDEIKSEKDILHLTLHNILLQGIIGHMDTSDVYKKLHSLVSSFKYGANEKYDQKIRRLEEFYPETTTQKKVNLNDEQTMIEDLLKYNMREQETRDSFTNDHLDTNDEDEIRREKIQEKTKGSKYVIKTLIDIKKDKNISSKENFQGIIKLIYNGKPIKIRGEDDETTTTTEATETTETTKATETTKVTETTEATETTEISQTTKNTLNEDVNLFAEVLRENFKNRHMPDSYLKSVLLEYLKKFKNCEDDFDLNSTVTEKEKTRMKRNIYSIEKQTELPQTKDDDELFVEIETHFDKKGLNGERKRKIVRSLIEKIQNAIASEPEKKEMNKSRTDSPILKRIQNPLSRDAASNYILNTMIPSVSSLREINPLSKSVPILESLPYVANYKGENWKRENDEPKFLSTSKSINSAEMSLLDVDYKYNTNYRIPERVQIPLTLDSSDEAVNIADLGKLQLLIKDIEGTGFSIGYNQYIDQAPDPESIKLFHGIEHLVNEYHQEYDKPEQSVNQGNGYEMYGQQMNKREVPCNKKPMTTNRRGVNRHNVKRAINKINDYHTNTYEYMFNGNSRSYNAHKEIYDIHDRSADINKNTLKDMSFNLKVNSSRNNAFRRKRSVKVDKVVKLNKKIQVNKFLNTNPVQRQRKNYKIIKRNKRQVNNVNLVTKSEEAGENMNMFIVSNADMYNEQLVFTHKQTPELFFGVGQEPKVSNRKPILKGKPFFQPINQPHSSRIFGISNKKPKDFMRGQENKERYKRQVHKIRIIARDMTHKNSDERTITQYNEDMYQLDGPQIILSDGEKRQTEYAAVENESVIYRNPKEENNEYNIFESNSPAVFNRDKHVFAFDPVSDQLRENPLMLKYPHIFVEDTSSREFSEPKYVPRNVPRYESKETDISSDREVLQPEPHVQELINAVAPTNRDYYKVSVKLIPHNNDNNTDMGFKEIHTSINKTFNKNGLLYSSLVNVSEISKIEVSNNSLVNMTHLCGQHFKSTTPANIKYISNLIKSIKPSQIEKAPETDFKASKNLAVLNEQRDQILSIIKKEFSVTTTEKSTQMNLMDIILPSSPNNVFHLTLADLGKLICNSMKSKDAETTTTTTTEKNTPETTITTTLPTTKAVSTTTEPEKHATNPQIVDPLKFKLLKAISQNEQLTSQILDKINQNTDILQTFLAKITREIAKLPNIAHQAIMARNEKDNSYTNARPNLSNVMNKTEVPFVYANPQGRKSQEIKPEINFNSNLIPVSPLIKNVRPNDMTDKGRIFKGNASDESRRRDHTKYFIDDDHNKTPLPQTIPDTESHNAPIHQFVNKISKHNVDTSNSNYDTPLILNNVHRIDHMSSNAIVQNNTAHYLV